MVTRYSFWSLLFFWLSASTLSAQSYLCEHSLRYEDYVVLKVDTIEDVFYRRSESLGGKYRELKMDIFKPANDPVTRRPAVLLAHGGGFVAGKKESLHKHCLELASRGYVCATAQYRLIDTLVLNEKDYLEGAMRAVMDIAYAIQFLRSNALAQNDFGIDPELIFVGGFSAGAVAALHVNFLDPDEMESRMLSETMRKEWQQLLFRGISYRPAGALSFAGALLDSSWIDRDDPPLLSYHNTGDEVVPCSQGVSKRSISRTAVYGSCFIHEQLQKFPEYVQQARIFEQKGHMNFLGSIPQQEFYRDICSFAKSVICSHYEKREKAKRLIDIGYQPNPQGNHLRLDIALEEEESFHFSLLNADGDIMYQKQYPHAQRILFPLSNLENGIYLVRLVGASDQSIGRIMVLR